MRRLRALAFGLLAGTCVLPPTYAAKPESNKLATIRVQDLHYGDVLWRLYAGKSDFDTLTALEAYQHWNRMPHHADDAALLAGSLYLSLGMHNEAGRRFEALLTTKVPAGVRNRAWFYLAQVWYARGYYDRTLDALHRISGKLLGELESERQNLTVNALMRQGRFDEAEAQLANWHGSPYWMAYAQLNLGVALVRQNRMDEADRVLAAVGTLDVAGTEMLALRDKANLALGYAWLQAKNPQAALVALNRVRLTGPYATRALLGAGWANAGLKDYQQALVPWLELHDRNLLDAAVQESYLAVPWAYGQLGAGAQAAQYYEAAIQSFDEESGRLDTAIDEIGNGHLLDQLLSADKDGQQGWFWQLKQLPDAPQSRYLYALLADNDFQEGLKNYRDLTYLGSTLDTKQQDMDTFDAMIDTRQKAYDQELPKTDALLATDAPTRLRAERGSIDSELTAIETGSDVAALGTSEERAQWERVRRLEEALANAGTGQDLDEARAKLKLIKGVLYWRLDAAFKARVYAKRRELRALDASLNEAQNRWVRVQSARQSVPNDTGEFAARIAALAQRISALKAALASAGQRQNGYLVELSQNELGAQKGRLAAYEVEARFALADIYDRASTPKTPAPAPPAPGEEAAPDDSGSAPQDAPAPMPVPDSGTAPAPAPGTPP
jgi:hypothetical protein